MSDQGVSQSEFIIKIVFDDGLVVDLGGGDELFVSVEDSKSSVTLNDARLALIKRVQEAQNEL